MRTLVVSPLCAVSVEAIESINAELRRGGPLVGRTSRRVSQRKAKTNRSERLVTIFPSPELLSLWCEDKSGL